MAVESQAVKVYFSVGVYVVVWLCQHGHGMIAEQGYHLLLLLRGGGRLRGERSGGDVDAAVLRVHRLAVARSLCHAARHVRRVLRLRARAGVCGEPSLRVTA